MHDFNEFKMEVNSDPCVKEICDIASKMTSCFKSYVESGIDSLSSEEAMNAADVIKDMMEAKAACFKAQKDYYESLYYKTVVEAMDEKNEDDMSPYGYNRFHTNAGRFATKGNGHMVGYRPYIDQEPYINGYLHDPNFSEKMRMGYENNTNYGSPVSNKIGYDQYNMNSNDQKYGVAYNEYKMAKRHYTQTNNASDKDQMNMKADEHIHNMISSAREIWDGADTAQRKRMYNDLHALVEEMKV